MPASFPTQSSENCVGDGRLLKRCKATPRFSQSSLLQQHVKTERTTSSIELIDNWLSHFEDTAQLETVSDAASISTRPPRSSATSRSRSSSPSKLTSQNYRAQVLKRVDIHVDIDVPDATREQLLPRVLPFALSDTTIQSVAKELYQHSRELSEGSKSCFFRAQYPATEQQVW
jgi:hypothetical protein